MLSVYWNGSFYFLLDILLKFHFRNFTKRKVYLNGKFVFGNQIYIFFQEICIPEQIKWLECRNEKMTFSKDKMSSWIKEGSPINTSENNLFCDQNVYQDVLKAKVNSLKYF